MQSVPAQRHKYNSILRFKPGVHNLKDQLQLQEVDKVPAEVCKAAVEDTLAVVEVAEKNKTCPETRFKGVIRR